MDKVTVSRMLRIEHVQPFQIDYRSFGLLDIVFNAAYSDRSSLIHLTLFSFIENWVSV